MQFIKKACSQYLENGKGIKLKIPGNFKKNIALSRRACTFWLPYSLRPPIGILKWPSCLKQSKGQIDMPPWIT